MTQPARVPCPKCGANNFPSSDQCWQCGEPLQGQQEQQPRQEQPSPTGYAEQTPGPHSPPEPPPASAEPPAIRTGDTDTLVILGIVCAVLGVCCGCLEIVAIILGAIAYSRGDQRGLWVLIAGIAILLLGTLLNLSGVFFRRSPWMPFPRHGGPFPRI